MQIITPRKSIALPGRDFPFPKTPKKEAITGFGFGHSMPFKGTPSTVSSGGGGSGGGGPTIPSVNVVLYLKLDGTDATFTDSGPNNFTVTPAGAATQIAVDGAFGGKALSLGANTTDYVGVAASALFSLGDFTLTGRIRYPSIPTPQIEAMVDIGGYLSGFSFRYGQNNTQKFGYFYAPGSGPDESNLFDPLVADTWYEFSFCRAGTTTYIFLQGVLIGTFTPRGFTITATPAFRLGMVLAGGVVNLNARYYNDVMLANTALYTSDYTPRTQAFTLT